MDTTVGQVCQDSLKTEHANTEYAAEWGQENSTRYIKNSLLRLIGERDMGQNDPPRSDELSVTKMKALRFIEERGIGQKDPHHTDGLSVTSQKPRGHFVPMGLKLSLQMRLQAIHTENTS